MILKYNGIEIFHVSMHDFVREVVYDDTGNDPLFIRYRLNVSGIYNGQVSVTGDHFMQYRGEKSLSAGDVNTTRPPTDRLPVGVIPGPYRPALTDVAIREHLLTPRRKLLLLGHGHDDVKQSDVILESPGPDMTVDAKNGPHPISCNVTEQLGADVTWMINYQLETYTPVCDSMPALLSNRFSQYHDVDEHYNLTIVTEGMAIFRTDLLAKQDPPLNPDELRPFLSLPVPPGFKRHAIRVGHGGDTSSIRYSMTDVQQPWTFVAGRKVNATKISTNFTHAINVSGDVTESVLGAFERGYNLRWSRKAANAQDEPIGPPGGPPSRRKKGNRRPPPHHSWNTTT